MGTVPFTISLMKTGTYKHYKGKTYEVVDSAFHTETGEELVIYKALYETQKNNGGLWARPLKMFQENVNVNGKEIPRFEYIG